MNKVTITISDFEDALNIWGWGRWARSCWFRTKYPEWVKMVVGVRKDADPESFGRFIPEITDEYGETLDRAVSRLPERHRDVLVHFYVNRLETSEIAKDLNTSRYIVRQEREIALSILYGRLVDVDLG